MSKSLTAALAGFLAVAGAVSAGCAPVADSAVAQTTSPLASSTQSSSPATSKSSETSLAASPKPTPTPTPTPTPGLDERAKATAGHAFGTATLTIKKIGIKGVTIVSYSGTPDDGPGTQIQNTGKVAAAHGPWGGVAPCEVGNLMLTGHRTSEGAPLAGVPSLQNGDLVMVNYKGRTCTYRISKRLWIDFRTAADRARQSAPTPGRPGKPATRPWITLSTCATPEDNAKGLFWRDENHNPPHRIALVGYLV